MNCRSCKSRLSTYIDGELEASFARRVQEHLQKCDNCRKSELELRSLVNTLQSSPLLQPTAEETRNLAKIVLEKAKETDHITITRTRPWLPRVATAAVVIILILAGFWITLALLPEEKEAEVPAGKPTSETSLEQEGGLLGSEESTPGISQELSGTAADMESLIPSQIPKPNLVLSSHNYNADEIEQYSKDIGTRFVFYSNIWYDPKTSSGSAARLPTHDYVPIRERLAQEMLSLAQSNQGDPDSLRKALSMVSEALSDTQKPQLPCFAERAYFNGEPVWILSYSTPEDGYLFSDPQLALLAKLVRQIWYQEYQKNLSLLGSFPYHLLWNLIDKGYTVQGEGENQVAIIRLAENNNLIINLKAYREILNHPVVRLMIGESTVTNMGKLDLLEVLGKRVWVVNPWKDRIEFQPLP